MVSPARNVPASTRPVRIRPMNGSADSVVANIWNFSSRRESCAGAGTCSTIRSNKASRFLRGPSSSLSHQPARPEANIVGKSSWSSSASSAAKRSNTSLTALSGSPSALSTLFTTTMGRRPRASALDVTNFVCGIAPSAASTSSTTPSTIDRMRSTSPPKSAWPGVSTMLIRTPFHSTDVFLARMVMPRSRSISLLSIARSCVASFSRYTPDCFRSSSTSVVLPWSTWAIIATLRISMR